MSLVYARHVVNPYVAGLAINRFHSGQLLNILPVNLQEGIQPLIAAAILLL